MRRKASSSHITRRDGFSGRLRFFGRSRRSAVSVVGMAALSMLVPTVAFASNDPLFAQQWDMQQIGAPSAWSYSTGAGITVGLVDTGVDLTHEDLQGQIIATTNCIGAASDPTKCTGSGQDDNGHGTHVAGIIAAKKDNGLGVAGVASGAKLVVAKALDSTGAGADADVQAGIMWVVQHGAKVVNLSLGDGSVLPLGLGSTGGISAPLIAGIDYAWQNGAIPVLAAGNNGQGVGSSILLGSILGSTAAFGTLNAVIVGATTPTGQIAQYSSIITNDQWAIVAPGGANDGKTADDVISTYWTPGNATNAYQTLAGTSMATPHVAGALADLLAEGYTQQGAIAQMLSTADKAVTCGTSCVGELDLSRAVGGPATPPPPQAGVTLAQTDPLAALLAALGL